MLAALLCVGAGVARAGADDERLPLDRPALAVRHPRQVALLAMALAGRRVVAVGERGVVLQSDDRGAHWAQAAVPVSVTLTAVRFVDDRSGWACGHGGVLLHTEDAGRTWTKQADGRTLARQAAGQLQAGAQGTPAAILKVLAEPLADKPLLDLAFADAREGFAVGAYGLFVRTRDGGRSWQLASAALPNPKALHLNAIVVRGRFVLVAGEQGSVFVSNDGGDSFEAVAAPYRGSFFAAALAEDGTVALAGLRGNLVLGREHGSTWTALKLPTDAGVTVLDASARELRAGAQDGQLFAIDAASGEVRVLPRRAPPMLTSWVDVGTAFPLTAGLHGIAPDPSSPQTD